MLEVLVYGVDVSKLTDDMFNFILILIVLDILTGLLLAGKERKLNSSINLDGLFRKLGILVGVFFLSIIDVYFKTDGVIIKTGIALLITYEGLSIVENLSRLGIKLDFVTKYFDKDKVTKDE